MPTRQHIFIPIMPLHLLDYCAWVTHTHTGAKAAGVCVWVYVFMCAYLSMCVCVHVWVCVFMCAYLSMCVCVCLSVYGYYFISWVATEVDEVLKQQYLHWLLIRSLMNHPQYLPWVLLKYCPVLLINSYCMCVHVWVCVYVHVWMCVCVRRCIQRVEFLRHRARIYACWYAHALDTNYFFQVVCDILPNAITTDRRPMLDEMRSNGAENWIIISPKNLVYVFFKCVHRRFWWTRLMCLSHKIQLIWLMRDVCWFHKVHTHGRTWKWAFVCLHLS